MSITGLIIAIVFFVTGLAGTVLPLLPGAPLIWVGMLIYGLISGFNTLGVAFFIVQAVIVGLTLLIDYISGAWGANRYGGSKASVWGSVIGGIVGVIVFSLPGLVLGPLVGAVAAELMRGEDYKKAFLVGWGTIVGFLGGTMAKFILEFIMIIWFFIQIF